MAKQVKKVSARTAAKSTKAGFKLPSKTHRPVNPRKGTVAVPKTAIIKKPKKVAAPKKAAPKLAVPKKTAALSKPAPAKKAPVPKPTKAPRPPKAPKPAKASGPAGYTPAEHEKYKNEVTRLNKFSNAELKDMLKKNMQSMSGNKDEMIAKIADGIVLGQIPRCPNCFGGR